MIAIIINKTKLNHTKQKTNLKLEVFYNKNNTL